MVLVHILKCNYQGNLNRKHIPQFLVAMQNNIATLLCYVESFSNSAQLLSSIDVGNFILLEKDGLFVISQNYKIPGEDS